MPDNRTPIAALADATHQIVRLAHRLTIAARRDIDEKRAAQAVERITCATLALEEALTLLPPVPLSSPDPEHSGPCPPVRVTTFHGHTAITQDIA